MPAGQHGGGSARQRLTGAAQQASGQHARTHALHQGSVAAEQRGCQRGSPVAGQHGSVAAQQHSRHRGSTHARTHARTHASMHPCTAQQRGSGLAGQQSSAAARQRFSTALSRSLSQPLCSDRGAASCATLVAWVQPALVARAKLPCTFVLEVCQVIITSFQWSQSGWHR